MDDLANQSEAGSASPLNWSIHRVTIPTHNVPKSVQFYSDDARIKDWRGCMPRPVPRDSRKLAAVSMRFFQAELDVIDRGAAAAGLSRTEFMRRASLIKAQMGIVEENRIVVTAAVFQSLIPRQDRAPTPPAIDGSIRDA